MRRVRQGLRRHPWCRDHTLDADTLSRALRELELVRARIHEMRAAGTMEAELLVASEQARRLLEDLRRYKNFVDLGEGPPPNAHGAAGSSS